MSKEIEKFMTALEASTCAYTAVSYVENELIQNGFLGLRLEDKWQIEMDKKYYVKVYDSSLIAFYPNKQPGKLKICAAHTDQPGVYVKPKAETNTELVYGKLNVEIYGGPILNTWLDRPLGLAGRIALNSKKNEINPEIRIFDSKRPIGIIPNLAIHLNRDVNKGVELNKQNDMAPLVTLIKETLEQDKFLLKYLAKELSTNEDTVEISDILDYELYMYNYDKPMYLGLNDELISSPRIDNISGVDAILQGFIKTSEDRTANDSGINVAAFFDNEEIGSRTKQGADSMMLSMIMERIYLSVSNAVDNKNNDVYNREAYNREAYLRDICNGLMISIDVAHAAHPNHMEKSDITNKVFLGKGIVIKKSAQGSYATDCQMIGTVKKLCDKNNIQYQVFETRSDITNGSTLGPISDKYLPMNTIDVGIPILAMHSARETCEKEDQINLVRLVEALYGI